MCEHFHYLHVCSVMVLHTRTCIVCGYSMLAYFFMLTYTLPLIPVVLIIILCKPLPVRALEPSIPPTSPTWRSTMTVDMTFWIQSMRQPNWKIYRKICIFVCAICSKLLLSWFENQNDLDKFGKSTP